jgi:peptidoglycan hydrolase-like protein with peptidoglycan-binding domain
MIDWDIIWSSNQMTTTFGSDGNLYEQVQTKLNLLGAFPKLIVDGNFGPKSSAALSQFQSKHGISPADGKLSADTLTALGLSSLIPKFNSTPNVATVIAALTQAAKEKGYTLSPQLASLMIGQLRGAEGAMPGLGGTLGGTNNYGASQVTKGLAEEKKGLPGWGAFAHKDSDPNTGPYIGWYWIAPSALEGARYWLKNWWGDALLKGNPTTPEEYATILYKGRYFAGNHPGDAAHDPNSDAGKQNIADYAAGIKRGMPSQSELNESPKDHSAMTVDPSSFASLSARGITENMFDSEKTGTWSWLIPQSWLDLMNTNGSVFFGPVPSGLLGSAQIRNVAMIAAPVLIVGGVGLLMLGGVFNKKSHQFDT